MTRKPLIRHKQIARLGRFLDMLYKPSELANEIGVDEDTVYRSYIPAGLPCLRKGHTIWIHGPAFVQWAKEIAAQRRQKNALPKGHAFCVKCNRSVPMDSPRVVHANRLRKIIVLQSTCPNCLRAINRIAKEEPS
jgi:hypothetical protein